MPLLVVIFFEGLLVGPHSKSTFRAAVTGLKEICLVLVFAYFHPFFQIESLRKANSKVLKRRGDSSWGISGKERGCCQMQ